MNAAERLKQVPATCYRPKDHKGAKLVCEENGRRIVFTKTSGQRVSKIRVDGCAIKKGPACDYLVHDWKGRYHFVELKGGDVEKAFHQLTASVAHFFPAGLEGDFWCFVVCSKSPPNSLPLVQNAQRRLKQKWGRAMTLKIKVNVHTHHLTN